jgi:hypothetical protein
MSVPQVKMPARAASTCCCLPAPGIRAHGYIPVRFETYNAYSFLRAIAANSSPEDVAKALDLVKKVRIYKLSEASNPPEQRSSNRAAWVTTSTSVTCHQSRALACAPTDTLYSEAVFDLDAGPVTITLPDAGGRS